MSRIPSGCQTYSKGPNRFDGAPRLAVRAEGCQVWDDAGRKYVDMVAGLGPVILGHRDPDVENAVLWQMSRGICFPWPTALEEELAELLAGIFPSAEMSRFAKNGADATAAAVRIARAYTNRDYLISIGYHGYQDWYMAKDPKNWKWTNPGGLYTLDCRYNDLDEMESKFQNFPIAAVIMEPIVGQDPRWPSEGYLEGVRDLCHRYGALLIFDEMVTAFRLALGGAQEYFKVTPDLACLGKAMGNGYPISAVVGKREYMKLLDEGVFFSTTFAGDALGLAAALACVRKLKEYPPWWTLAKKCLDAFVLRGVFAISEAAKARRVEIYGYAARPVVKWTDPEDAAIFTKAMLANGVVYQGYFSMMLAHDEEALAQVKQAIVASLEAVTERKVSRV